MKAFLTLWLALHESMPEGEATELLSLYFKAVCPADAAWAARLLVLGSRKRWTTRERLLEAAMALSGLPEWLFGECLSAVQDLAETAALVCPEDQVECDAEMSLSEFLATRVFAVKGLDGLGLGAELQSVWPLLGAEARLFHARLLLGGLRSRCSRQQVVAGIAAAHGISATTLNLRLDLQSQPSAEQFLGWISRTEDGDDACQPYPLACISEMEAGTGSEIVGVWTAEPMPMGRRVQLVRRGGRCALWNERNELIEVQARVEQFIRRQVPDGTVLDGVWSDAGDSGAKSRPEFVVFDLLEWNCVDQRGEPLCERRKLLDFAIAGIVGAGMPSVDQPVVTFRTAEVNRLEDGTEAIRLAGASRCSGAVGVLLRRWEEPYPLTEAAYDWHLLKAERMTITAILMYFERPSAAHEAPTVTLGAFRGNELVPLAKAVISLDDDEVDAIKAYSRANTVERFGPVRSVKPQLVFELEFAGVDAAPRRKSGILLREPRVLRWRCDLTLDAADPFARIEELVAGMHPRDKNSET